ncbi:MAG: 4-hydroxythreonine-4-phosphate dehydrogenase PdxA [Verrucomicrobiae bacterium]|nr:4-hydroxythreonine-4-phosphate dehydrogenase PdxA [Verrucomicrobiae bacterium]
MIGICIGDVTGIGPEVTLKALAELAGQDQERYLLIGDGGWLERLNDRFNIGLPLSPYDANDAEARFLVLTPGGTSLPDDLSPGSPAAARAALSALREAAERCLRQELSAMVTAPVNKEAIIRCGIPFIGQTEYLAAIAGNCPVIMMLLGADDRGRWLRVALVTTHVAIKLLPAEITQPKVELAINMAAQACRDLDLPRHRIAVCGLNPHAGEGGEFGDEEITTIRPAVLAARSRGLDVHGPLAADTVFYHAAHGAYDAVVAMYHDQGLGPLKLLAFEHGVNWTLGLPFIRTSPDHGTAYDLAGRGTANPSSMKAAISLARQLAARRA